MYETLGYLPADEQDLNDEYEMVALFAKDGKVKHAARRLANGKWTSKLGRSIDIEHALKAVEGDEYGTVVQYLQRPKE